MGISAEEAHELLSQYADGELTPEERAELEKVLIDDPDLAYESTQIRNLKALIRYYEGEGGTERFKEAVISRVASSEPSAKASRTILLLAILSALAAVIAAAAWRLWQHLSE